MFCKSKKILFLRHLSVHLQGQPTFLTWLHPSGLPSFLSRTHTGSEVPQTRTSPRILYPLLTRGVLAMCGPQSYDGLITCVFLLLFVLRSTSQKQVNTKGRLFKTSQHQSSSSPFEDNQDLTGDGIKPTLSVFNTSSHSFSQHFQSQPLP